MTCNEYRERLRVQVTAIQAGADAPQLEHAAGCPACARFTGWLMSLDLALRDLPREPVPAPLISDVRDIALRPPPLPWGPDLIRGAACIVPAVLLWEGRTLLPDALQFIPSAALAFAGVFLLVTAAFRPRLLGPSV